MFYNTKLEILKQELQTDPLNKGYAGKDFYELVSLLNTKNLVNNPAPQGNITIYNITNTTSSIVLANLILSIIPLSELAALKMDNLGVLFYDRLVRMELLGQTLDVSEQTIKDVIISWKTMTVISQNTEMALIGTQSILDPNYQAQIAEPSRAEVLGIFPSDIHDIRQVL